MIYDIAIIGAGSAGLTAALYSRRNNKSVLVLEGASFGGQISESPLVENYPAIKQISGMEFADKLMEQVSELGAVIEPDTVKSIEYLDKFASITTDYSCYSAKAVIIATGSKSRKLGLKDEDKFLGRGIAYCAVCDGAFYKDKDVAVAGGGDSAFQEAIFLSNICKSVSIIHRRDDFRASEFLIEKAGRRKNIHYITNSIVDRIIGEDVLSGLEITNNKDNSKTQLDIECLFVSIGRIPQTDLIKDLVELDSAGFAIADESCRTNHPWLFVAGDLRQKELRQLTTAMSDGSIAALAAGNYLDSLED